MLIYGAITIACLYPAQIFSQYLKAVRGTAVPFDTAVIIEIGQYRLETKKLRLANLLVNSYGDESAGLYRQAIICDSLHMLDSAMIASFRRLVDSKDYIIAAQRDNMQMLLKLSVPHETWWSKNKLWISFIAGGAVSYICFK